MTPKRKMETELGPVAKWEVHVFHKVLSVRCWGDTLPLSEETAELLGDRTLTEERNQCVLLATAATFSKSRDKGGSPCRGEVRKMALYIREHILEVTTILSMHLGPPTATQPWAEAEIRVHIHDGRTYGHDHDYQVYIICGQAVLTGRRLVVIHVDGVGTPRLTVIEGHGHTNHKETGVVMLFCNHMTEVSLPTGYSVEDLLFDAVQFGASIAHLSVLPLQVLFKHIDEDDRTDTLQRRIL